MVVILGRAGGKEVVAGIGIFHVHVMFVVVFIAFVDIEKVGGIRVAAGENVGRS